MSAPTVVAVETAQNSAGLSGGLTVTIDRPVGADESEWMVAYIRARDRTGTGGDGSITDITGPAGWDRLHFEGGAPADALFVRQIGPLFSEPADYAFTSSGGSGLGPHLILGGIALIAGAHPSDAVSDWAYTRPSGSSDTIELDEITPAHISTLLLGFAGVRSEITFTPPSGHTEHWDFSGGPDATVSQTCASQPLTDSGATGSRTFTISGSVTGRAGYLIAIRPPPEDRAATAVETAAEAAGEKVSDGTAAAAVDVAAEVAGRLPPQGGIDAVVEVAAEADGSPSPRARTRVEVTAEAAGQKITDAAAAATVQTVARLFGHRARAELYVRLGGSIHVHPDHAAKQVEEVTVTLEVEYAAGENPAAIVWMSDVQLQAGARFMAWHPALLELLARHGQRKVIVDGQYAWEGSPAPPRVFNAVGRGHQTLIVPNFGTVPAPVHAEVTVRGATSGVWLGSGVYRLDTDGTLLVLAARPHIRLVPRSEVHTLGPPDDGHEDRRTIVLDHAPASENRWDAALIYRNASGSQQATPDRHTWRVENDTFEDPVVAQLIIESIPPFVDETWEAHLDYIQTPAWTPGQVVTVDTEERTTTTPPIETGETVRAGGWPMVAGGPYVELESTYGAGTPILGGEPITAGEDGRVAVGSESRWTALLSFDEYDWDHEPI